MGPRAHQLVLHDRARGADGAAVAAGLPEELEQAEEGETAPEEGQAVGDGLVLAHPQGQAMLLEVPDGDDGQQEQGEDGEVAPQRASHGEVTLAGRARPVESRARLPLRGGPNMTVTGSYLDD